MNRRLIIGGVFLTVSIIWFIVALAGGANKLLADLFCEEKEHLAEEHSSYIDSDGEWSESTRYECQNSDFIGYDVTGRVVLTIVGGYVIPFSLGLFLMVTPPGTNPFRWVFRRR